VAGAKNLGQNPPTTFGSKALLNGVDTSSYNGLWITDGTTAGTVEIAGLGNASLNGGASFNLDPQNITTFGSKAVFAGKDAASGLSSLWVTDGTLAGTFEIGGSKNAGIADANTTSGFQPTNFVSSGGNVVFEAANASNNQTLWVTDGTLAGTFEIGGHNNAGVAGSPSYGLYSGDLIAAGDHAFFHASDSSSNYNLWVTDGTAAGTHELVNVAGAAASGLNSGQGVVATVGALSPTDNFLGHGMSDLLIQNSAGAVVAGEVSNGALAYTTLAGLGAEWKFVGNGDFLGDGVSSVLIENSSGAVTVGELKNGAESFTQVASLGSEWKFREAGDFLGHGHAQFLIENAAGAVVVGDAAGGSAQYYNVGGLGSEWQFEGAGDFLGEGHSQFLVENGNGAVVIGDVKNDQAVYTEIGSLGSEWKFVGTGDYLGKGHDQFLIENTNGAVVVGDVQNGQAVYSHVAGLGSEWSFIGHGDYAGNGVASFLIENTTGAVALGVAANGQTNFTQVGALGSEWTSHA
jgi:ELWxxDGT repeat protein